MPDHLPACRESSWRTSFDGNATDRRVPATAIHRAPHFSVGPTAPYGRSRRPGTNGLFCAEDRWPGDTPAVAHEQHQGADRGRPSRLPRRAPPVPGGAERIACRGGRRRRRRDVEARSVPTACRTSSSWTSRCRARAGIELTQALHEKHPEVRVVMLTAFSDSERVFAALKAGAVGYLLKNVSPDEIRAHGRARRRRRADALG